MRKVSESKTLKVFKVAVTGAVAISLFLPVSSITATAAANAEVANEIKTFKDIRNDYWAAESIKWASSNGLIKGFPDGTFKPNEVLTEEQFTTMLTRFYNDIRKEVEETTDSTVKRWSDQKYEGLAHYKVPLLGYDDPNFRKNPVNRGLIAQVFAYLQGNKSDLEEAITFLFDEGISNGSNPNGKTIYEKFGTTDQLTRAQAVAFFKRFHDLGEVSIHPEVSANKIQIDRTVETVSQIKEKLEMAKKEAAAKVNPDVLPNKKEFIEKKKELISLKQQLIQEKKESGKSNGNDLSEIGKAIGEANKAGDFEKKQELIKEKQQLIQEKNEYGKSSGNDFSNIGKAIGDANKAGDFDKKQELIREKQQLIQEKKGSGKSNGNDNFEMGKAIGEANRAHYQNGGKK